MNKTTINKLLKECSFDPNKEYPFHIIKDVGNVDYYINRVREELAKLPTNRAQFKYTIDASLKLSISLLTLARAQLHEEPGSDNPEESN